MNTNTTRVLAVSLDPRLLAALMVRIGITEFRPTEAELKAAPPLVLERGVVSLNTKGQD